MGRSIPLVPMLPKRGEEDERPSKTVPLRRCRVLVSRMWAISMSVTFFSGVSRLDKEFGEVSARHASSVVL